MNIDAKDLILGRLASFAAKQALLRENINIVNCELAVISGRKKDILKKYQVKAERGDPFHGPYFPRISRELVRRTIRGMLPYAQPRGREAYKRIKCYTGTPEKIKSEKIETIEKANVKKIKNIAYTSVKELCKGLK